jgi:hypothetical protein
VSNAHLEMERSIYLTANSDPEFKRLLLMQRKNKGFSSLGLVYMVAARRMSGDMNTAIGNVVIMLAMMIGFCRHMLSIKWIVWMMVMT